MKLKEQDRVVHRLYGGGVLQHIQPGAPGKVPVFGHALFDDDYGTCGRRVLLLDLVGEPVPIRGQQRMEAVT